MNGDLSKNVMEDISDVNTDEENHGAILFFGVLWKKRRGGGADLWWV